MVYLGRRTLSSARFVHLSCGWSDIVPAFDFDWISAR